MPLTNSSLAWFRKLLSILQYIVVCTCVGSPLPTGSWKCLDKWSIQMTELYCYWSFRYRSVRALISSSVSLGFRGYSSTCTLHLHAQELCWFLLCMSSVSEFKTYRCRGPLWCLGGTLHLQGRNRILPRAGRNVTAKSRLDCEGCPMLPVEKIVALMIPHIQLYSGSLFIECEQLNCILWLLACHQFMHKWTIQPLGGEVDTWMSFRETGMMNVIWVSFFRLCKALGSMGTQF